MSEFNWASYWRKSLADASSRRGFFTEKEFKSLTSLDKKVQKEGALSIEESNALFKNEKKDVEVIFAIYRPSVWRLKKEHAVSSSGVCPDVITPLLCPVWVNRWGQLYPAGPVVVPRDLLNPQFSDKFTVGNVVDLDSFLTGCEFEFFEKSQVPVDKEFSENLTDGHKKVWADFVDHCVDLYNQVCGDNENFEWSHQYQKLDQVLLDPVNDVSGVNTKIIKLYDDIRTSKPDLPLFRTYTEKTKTDVYRKCTTLSDSITIRKGHFNDEHSLAVAQRDALTETLAMREGEILAINGPPGTGKTSFILSVIASLWIKAALDEDEPPFIVAASTNNQAVTNVIDAFGSDFGEGTGVLAGRWLPDIKSYGAFFPSKNKQSGYEKKYQTEVFFHNVENTAYLSRAEAEYIEKAKLAFTLKKGADLEAISQLIHQEMVGLNSILGKAEDAWNKLQAFDREVLKLLGKNPQKQLELMQSVSLALNDKHSKIKKDKNSWQRYLANESLLLGIFSFVPFIKNRIKLKRQVFIQDELTDYVQTHINKLDHEQIADKLSELNSELKLKISASNKDFESANELMKQLSRAKLNWQRIYETFLDVKKHNIDLVELDGMLDKKVRFQLFRLAVHYWEARWLIENKALKAKLNDLKKKKGKKTVIPRWHRRMMLTPCIVSTFHSLPPLLTCSLFNDGSYIDEPLYNVIDLLIVDEAGQVSSEAAGASFALAKKAIVIGDVHQIKPISSSTGSVDYGNLASEGLVSDDKDYDQISTGGRSVVDGSVMKIGQTTSKYHYLSDAEPGMYLREHFRCYNEIINYCNDLCYGGLLLPQRGQSPKNTPYPALGYLHIDGKAVTKDSGSRCNMAEANTIASWLSDNREKIEAAFKGRLEDVVGVVTPFTAQSLEIQKACRNKGISTHVNEGGITVGTVHSLQGAARELVIFSPVYSRHNDGGFIDNDPSLLNVAVSRAKKSFLVFGDMDVFSASATSNPRGILASHLFQDSSQELSYKVLRRPDLPKNYDEPQIINNAQEHDNFLIRVLESAKHSVNIISPWLYLKNLESTQFFTVVEESIKRGLSVKIYTDKDFNTKTNGQLDDEKNELFINSYERLISLGVEVIVINGVHSKLVMMDEGLISLGSFNWLSASRDDRYANLETSFIYSGNLSDEINLQLKFLHSRIEFRKMIKKGVATK